MAKLIKKSWKIRERFYEISVTFKETPFPQKKALGRYELEEPRLQKFGYTFKYELFVAPGEKGFIDFGFFKKPEDKSHFDLVVALYMGKEQIDEKAAKPETENENQLSERAL